MECPDLVMINFKILKFIQLWVHDDPNKFMQTAKIAKNYIIEMRSQNQMTYVENASLDVAEGQIEITSRERFKQINKHSLSQALEVLLKISSQKYPFEVGRRCFLIGKAYLLLKEPQQVENVS